MSTELINAEKRLFEAAPKMKAPGWWEDGSEEKDKKEQGAYKDLDEWAQKEKGYPSYAAWYLDNMD